MKTTAAPFCVPCDFAVLVCTSHFGISNWNCWLSAECMRRLPSEPQYSFALSDSPFSDSLNTSQNQPNHGELFQSGKRGPRTWNSQRGRTAFTMVVACEGGLVVKVFFPVDAPNRLVKWNGPKNSVQMTSKCLPPMECSPNSVQIQLQTGLQTEPESCVAPSVASAAPGWPQRLELGGCHYSLPMEWTGQR